MKQETQNEEIFPDHANIYAYRTEDTSAVAIVGRVERQHAMPFDDIEAIKNSLSSLLKEDEGLIKADSGITGNGERYIYYIKKHVAADEVLNNGTAYIATGKNLGQEEIIKIKQNKGELNKLNNLNN